MLGRWEDHLVGTGLGASEAWAAGYRAGYAKGRLDSLEIFVRKEAGLPQEQRCPDMATWRAIMARCHPDVWESPLAGAITRWLLAVKPAR